MKTQRRHRLIDINWPEFGTGVRPDMPAYEEFADRIEKTRARMDREGLTHLVVYSDREHFANLAWLTGFDPRFEESLLILGQKGKPLILTGNEWFSMLKIGTSGGEFSSMINKRLPFQKFEIYLNPGHLIHLDEWLSSPFYSGSEIRVHSGMVIQSDVIPRSSVYFSTRMEDGLVIADLSLRSELSERFPDCYDRCQKRRKFMIEELGIELPDEVFPLSNIPGIVPPFFLSPNTILALEK